MPSAYVHPARRDVSLFLYELNSAAVLTKCLVIRHSVSMAGDAYSNHSWIERYVGALAYSEFILRNVMNGRVGSFQKRSDNVVGEGVGRMGYQVK